VEQTIINVVIVKKEKLTISIMAFVIVLILASSIINIIEPIHQPDPFSSIPSTLGNSCTYDCWP
tara:strand:+ start:39 stop:230 length:192 start_codon:yes stop_codon:yes gene_type:complete